MRIRHAFVALTVVVGSATAQRVDSNTVPNNAHKVKSLPSSEGPPDYSRLLSDVVTSLAKTLPPKTLFNSVVTDSFIVDKHGTSVNKLTDRITASCSYHFVDAPPCSVTLMMHDGSPSCITSHQTGDTCFPIDTATVAKYKAGLYALTQRESLEGETATDSLSTKHGLWELSMTNGLLVGNLILFPRTSRTLYCIPGDPAPASLPSAQCIPKVTEAGRTIRKIEFNCIGASIIMKSDLVVESPAAYTETVLTTTDGGDGKPMTFKGIVKAHFVSSECGDVRPGAPKDAQ